MIEPDWQKNNFNYPTSSPFSFLPLFPSTKRATGLDDYRPATFEIQMKSGRCSLNFLQWFSPPGRLWRHEKRWNIEILKYHLKR
jgi:hypothetical protein